MQKYRKPVLAVLAGLGLWMGVSIIHEWGVKFDLTVGVALFAIAIAVAAALFQGIRSGKLPLPVWYALPVIIGAGFAVLGNYNLKGWLSDVGGASLGMAALIVSFAGFRFWADSRGERGWIGIILFCGVLLVGGIVGTVSFFKRCMVRPARFF